MSWSLFNSRDDWASYLENLQSDRLCWKASSFYVEEVIIHGADNGSLLLLGFRGAESYSPLRVVCQFGWPEVIQPLSSHTNSSPGGDLASQSWENRQIKDLALQKTTQVNDAGPEHQKKTQAFYELIHPNPWEGRP